MAVGRVVPASVARSSLPSPEAPVAVGVTRLNTVHFFVARLEGGLVLHVPMYGPMTDDERAVMGLLRQAHRHGRAIQASFRRSAFWALDVATTVELA